MSVTYRDRLKTTISNNPGSGGNFTISTAVAAYATFVAGDNGKTFDVLISEGTAWEISKDCTYTHGTTTLSRGTFVSSSSGVPLTLTSAAQVSVEQISQRLVPFTITSPVTNQLIQFNGTDWVNTTIAASVVDVFAASFYGAA